MLETWASKLLNGEDHILNSTVPIFEKTLIKVALKASKGKKVRLQNYWAGDEILLPEKCKNLIFNSINKNN